MKPVVQCVCQYLQDCLEEVVNLGCAGLQEGLQYDGMTERQLSLFFDLKLVLGSRFCLCHKCVLAYSAAHTVMLLPDASRIVLIHVLAKPSAVLDT